MKDDKDFYTPEEREALRCIGDRGAPPAELEERVVAMLRRQGLLEAPEPTRTRPRLAGLWRRVAWPALVGVAAAGAFVLGRAIDRERPFRLVSVPSGEMPAMLAESGMDAHVHGADHAVDGVPRALFVTEDDDRRYEYYVDEEGHSYYVLVKLPMPRPVPHPIAEPSPPAAFARATAQTVPAMENNRFEYFYDTHGNAYGVLAKDAPAHDLFSTR
jgi:hypothetical protein